MVERQRVQKPEIYRGVDRATNCNAGATNYVFSRLQGGEMVALPTDVAFKDEMRIVCQC